jgi:[acyl-carrier-protein] S-malonyltransferase
MGRIAFVFPGQGSQHVGMGRAVFETDAGRRVFAEADAALGEPLSRLCFEGPDTELRRTENAQPALLTTSIALLRGLEETCDAVAGHSLGEYTANVAAGTLDFEEAVALVRKRGRYMQEAVPLGLGGMAAIFGVDCEIVERVCIEAGAGAVTPANYNCPGQVVIAGETAALEQTVRALQDVGGKVRALSVSAPFHCPLMQPAEHRLSVELRRVSWSAPRIPIYSNVDATAISSVDAAREALLRQVSRPVRWQQTIERMLADGVSLFVEIGAGKVLSTLIRRIAKEVERSNIETTDDIAAARSCIARHR